MGYTGPQPGSKYPYPEEEHYYEGEKIKKNTPFYHKHAWKIATFVLIGLLVVLLFYTFLTPKQQVESTVHVQPTSAISQLPPTAVPTQVPPAPTEVPTQVPPTPTIVPVQQTSGTILCQPAWSQWTLSSHWSVLNDVIVNDGNDGYTNWLVAPCTLNTRDYAIESEMRIDNGCNAHGLVARAVGSNNYASGSYCQGGDAEIWLWGSNATTHQDLAHHSYEDGNTWHTYRMEVKGNELRLLIDGKLMCDVINDTILSSGGQVGIWSQNEQLEVRSFVVTSL